MAAFAPWPAALAGFRLVRERPLAVLVWTGVMFVGRLASSALIAYLAGPGMAAFNAALDAPTIDPEAVRKAYQAVAPGILAGLLLALPFMAVVGAAIFRAYLRPEEGKIFYMRLGWRELAILGLTLSLNVLLTSALVMGIGVASGLASLAAGYSGDAAQIVEIAGLAATVLIAAWCMVRLCLAWPMSFQSGRVRIFASWPYTRAPGWSLVGAFVMGEALMLLVFVLIGAIAWSLGGAAMLASGGTLEQLADAFRSPSSLQDLMRPLPVFFLAVEALVLTLTAATLQGVAVSAYRTLIPRGAEEPLTRA